MTTGVLEVRAMQLAVHGGLTQTDFKANRCWITKFMKRRGLLLRRHMGICQKLATEFEEKHDSFHRYVLILCRTHSYQLKQIVNTDQTSLYFDMPATTVETDRARQIRVLHSGQEKT